MPRWGPPPAERSGSRGLSPLWPSVLLITGCAWAYAPPSNGWLESYVSEVDGSRQYYGVWVPEVAPPGPAGYPVVLHMHGYGWSVSPRFSEWQRQWGAEHGWIMCNVNGRGPTFYDGIGENDIYNVLSDLELRFGIDEDRIFTTGGSMGGTGAHRFGVRRPDTAAATAGVDGWTDWREYHWHWYARKDMREAIEEFRRPLLEATSPFYVAGTAQTGNVGVITDMLDTVVLPENGLRLTYALLDWQHREGGFNSAAIIEPNRGHGGGYDLRRIYRYFEAKSRQTNPRAVRVQTTQLKYGQVHWVRLERLFTPGKMAQVAALLDGDTVTVWTANVRAFSLLLPNSPARHLGRVRVVADTKEAYVGPPGMITCSRVHDAHGRFETWTTDGELPPFRKSPELEGPLGDAFVKPFILLYGAAGSDAETAQNRREAEAFAGDWNNQHIHAPTVKVFAEEALSERDRLTKNLIIFGTIESSRLLQEAHGAAPLPVEAHSDGVVVHDTRDAPRDYRGEQYGCFLIYPNPLSAWRTYLVVSHGTFATNEEGARQQNLGYDLEKLPWAWPDYVVFDMDQRELAYVGNVNDKAHTLCYEAGYFVEAGFFDDQWQPQRDLHLRRWRAGDPRGGLVHVAALEVRLDERKPAGAVAKVKVVDHENHPVEMARVTVGWRGGVQGAGSGVTDEKGEVALSSPLAPTVPTVFVGRVLNVMATGATYDFPADAAREAVAHAGSASDVAVEFVDPPSWSLPASSVTLRVRVSNRGTRADTVRVALEAETGGVWPEAQHVWVPEGGSRDVVSTWFPDSDWRGHCVLAARAECAAGDGSLGDNLARAMVEIKGRPTD